MIATAVWAVDGEARIRYRCGMLPRFHCWSCKCLLLQRGLLQLLLICVCSCGYIGTSRPVLAATTSVFCDSERGTRGFATAGRFFFFFRLFCCCCCCCCCYKCDYIATKVCRREQCLPFYAAANTKLSLQRTRLQSQICACSSAKREVRNDCRIWVPTGSDKAHYQLHLKICVCNCKHALFSDKLFQLQFSSCALGGQR